MTVDLGRTAGAGSRAWRDDRACLDPSSLRRLFLDALGRPPLEAERAAWLGKAREELVDALLSMEEFWRNWLEEQLYYFLLIDNFRPATDGILQLPSMLAKGAIGVREALHRICLSSSFDRRNPGPDTFVSVVMEQILGLTVQRATRELEIGKKVYDGSRGTFLGRQGSSQADIVDIALSDNRALSHLLEREHLRIIRSTPSIEDVKRWSGQLAEDTLAFTSILHSWFVSESYAVRLAGDLPLPNRMFIRALHVDLLARLPDEIEVQRFRTALDGLADATPLRSLIARLILDSGKAVVPDRKAIHDPGAWIKSQFERLLGRPPAAAEYEAYLEALRDPACRPTTVLYAIVSHPQYQAW